MSFTRRSVLAGGSALAIASFAQTPAWASLVEEEIAKLTGGQPLGEGGIMLRAPEIAENGNTVPIEVSAPGASDITLFATGNPVPAVGAFKFGPLSGSRAGSTRIRLAKTQDVVAIAKMEDGSFRKASATVKVTIGGCGG